MTVSVPCEHEESDDSAELLQDSTDAVDRKLMPAQCLEGLSRLTSMHHGLDLGLNQQGHSGKNTLQRLPQALCCKEEPPLRRPSFERLGCDVALSSSLALVASDEVVRNLALSMLECRAHWP
eukprot:s2295_g5.t1